MAYCPKCGKQNADDARFCNNCGADMTTGRRVREDECGEACSGRSRSWGIFWGIIVILIGVAIVTEVIISNTDVSLPSWMTDWNWWALIFGVIFGALFIALGASILARGSRRHRQ